MKNITIAVDERLAAQARVEAAKAGQSLSRWVGGLIRTAVEERQPAPGTPDWLDAPAWPSIPAALPTRAEFYEQRYDRPGFRGHQRRDLHARSAGAGKGKARHPVDQGA